MFKWLGGKLLEPLLQTHLADLKVTFAEQVKTIVGQVVKDAVDAKMLKGEMYTYVDSLMAEAQTVSRDRLDAWWVQKRADLQAWAGK